MRTFVAIPLPERVKKRLRECQVQHSDIRWQSSDHFHITLRFLGNLKSDKVETVLEQLSSIECNVFDAVIASWGVFPKHGKPRILWAGVQKSEELLRLKNAIDAVCEKFTATGKHPSFTPHITLGRVQKAVRRPHLNVIMERAAQLNEQVTVNAFVLYESQLSNKGARHRIIKEYPLQH